MAKIAILVGSPSSPSRTAFAASHVGDLLTRAGHEVTTIAVRSLPAEDLIWANVASPEIAAAVASVELADAVVVATPIYKASFTGLLKVFLDLLPQFALAGKSVLVIATGGASAHVLAIDYALRPVLMSLGAAHVAPAYVMLEQAILAHGSSYQLTPDGASKLDEIATQFVRVVSLGAIG
jgi:FMN reductase